MEQTSLVSLRSRIVPLFSAAVLVVALFTTGTVRPAGAQMFDFGDGPGALASNVTGNDDDAFGVNALNLNTSGSFNTAVGGGALATNNGDNNTATGFEALLNNTTGIDNTATGVDALADNHPWLCQHRHRIRRSRRQHCGRR